ncbi:MAG: [LysW]-lysine hydrolase [Anaerolineae bacterium]|nr:[LysW]-lysine hydrolase [Anaerolineae bacterium]
MTHPRTAERGPDDAFADDLLTGLVERHSPSGEEEPAVAYLVERMRDIGFHAQVDQAGNAVGEIGEGARTILLLGHIDTVPGVIPVRREANLLYGRGTVDAKGPLAAFAVAAARVGALPGKRLVVVGAVEEEAATSKGARFLLKRPGIGDPPPDAVVIGEPSSWRRVTVGYKGRLLARYVLSREVGHTAGPAQSVGEQAFAFWSRVTAHADRWNADHDRMFDQLIPSLRNVNTEDDGFVETVCMVLGFRLPPEIDVDGLQETLRDLAGGARLHLYGREAAYRAPRSTSLARAFVRAIHAQGARATFQVKSGTSDMNVVGPVWGSPILAYGPGDALLDHTPREHIDLTEYHRAITVLVHVLRDL